MYDYFQRNKNIGLKIRDLEIQVHDNKKAANIEISYII